MKSIRIMSLLTSSVLAVTLLNGCGGAKSARDSASAEKTEKNYTNDNGYYF